MDLTKADFGALLDVFIQEFNCDPEQRNDICLFLTSAPQLEIRNSYDVIGKIRKKLAKRSESRAIEFSRLAQKLLSRNDIRDPIEVINFIISAKVRQGKRDDKENNLATTDLKAPSTSTKIISFAKPVRNEHHYLSSKHLKIERKLQSKVCRLNGRCSVPSVVSDEEIIRQVLGALQLLEGRYITRSGSREGPFRVDPCCSIDDSLLLHLIPVLSIANCYSELHLLVHTQSSDLLVQAFFNSFRDLLIDYEQIISDLYKQFLVSPSTVTVLYIRNSFCYWEDRLPMLVQIVKDNSTLNGMQIFNNLYLIRCSTPRGPMYQSLTTILSAMSNMIHEWFRGWLISGSLERSNIKCMIVQMDVSVHWNDSFKILDDKIPLIFSASPGLSKKILLIGKSVALMEKLDIASRSSFKRSRLFMEVMPDCYFNIIEAYQFFHVINKLYDDVNSELLQCLIDEYFLYIHLKTVREHFFLINEYFALNFYNFIRFETSGNISQLDSQATSAAFSGAIRLCESWPETLSSHARIDATCVTRSCDLKNPAFPSISSAGCPSVHLIYTAQAPLSIILNKSALGIYQRIFEFIWSVVFTDLRLTSILKKHSRLMSGVARLYPTLKSTCYLYALAFSRMSHFLFVLRSYINNVISSSSSKFSAQLDGRSNSLEKVIDLHHEYLIATESGLVQSDNCANLRALLIVSVNFISEMIALYMQFFLRIKCEISKNAFMCNSGDGRINDLLKTTNFEREEERIRFEEIIDEISSDNCPRIRSILAKFSLSMRDILCEIWNCSHVPHVAQFASALSLGDLYSTSNKYSS